MPLPSIVFLPFKKQAASAGVIVLLSILFMWISADFIYGAYADMVRQTMIIYFFTFLLVYTAVNGKPKSMDGESLWNFILGFIATSVILLGLSFVIAPLLSAANIAEPVVIASISITGLGFGVLHGFVKAYIEESVFRWALPKLANLGDIISNILFGVFHTAVLVTVTIPALVVDGTLADLGAANWTYAIMPVIMLVVLGFVWSYIRGTNGGGLGWGIMGATGSHMAYNLFALGILPLIFLGGIAP